VRALRNTPAVRLRPSFFDHDLKINIRLGVFRAPESNKSLPRWAGFLNEINGAGSIRAALELNLLQSGELRDSINLYASLLLRCGKGVRHMWILTVLIGFSLGAWIGAKYSITILTTALLVFDACVLATGLAEGWGILYLSLILFSATMALQAGYFASVSYRTGLASSWGMQASRSVSGRLPRPRSTIL
jgi:hypothetical protein